MTDQHSITPPPDLFKHWEDDILNERDNVDHVLDCVWKDGFRAGADQELEACCEEMKSIPSPLGIPFGEMASNALRAARRPEPPSLKEQALTALERWAEDEHGPGAVFHKGLEVGLIRRALEEKQ